LSRKGAVALAVLGLIAGVVVAPIVRAQDSMPADKAAVAGSKVEVIDPGETVTLLAAKLRTSSPSDLIFEVTAECALTTNITTVGNDMSRAFGQVKVWVEIDGVEVPVAAGDADGRVVFCNRAYERQTSGFDDQDATIKTFLETRNANAFNWMALNVGNGIHTVAVKGELTKEQTDNAMAKAAVGNRTLLIEPTKAAHNESLD
jgi:hypothetical protein